MTAANGLEALSSGVILSPFTQLRRLLEGIAPGHDKPIELTVGEPREAMPEFVVEKLKEAEAVYAKYPPIRGTDEFRNAIANWIARRYGADVAVDPATEILPLNGSREGLFYACLPAAGRKRVSGRPAILLPNPYYAAYIGGALAVNAEPIFLNATEATGHLPDLGSVARDTALLDRTVAFFLCSPANPQGAVADAAYVRRALDLARRHDFMLFFDECYSEIYAHEPPVGGLEVAVKTPERFRNLIVFNSLSKRSNLPGLRSGFCAGDAAFMETFAEIRNLVAPQVPGPTQHLSAAVWGEEQHVAVNRQAYRAKYDVCDAVLGQRYGYRRPAGGFFLLARFESIRGRRSGHANALETLWCQGRARCLSGAARR